MSNTKCILLPLLALLCVLYVHCHVFYVFKVDQRVENDARFRDTRMPKTHQSRIRFEDLVDVPEPHQIFGTEMQNTSCNAEYCFRTTTTISTYPLNYRLNLLSEAGRSSRTTTTRLERLVDEMRRRRMDYSRTSTRQDIQALFRDRRISDYELIEGKDSYLSRNIMAGIRRRRADHEQIRDLTARTERNLGTSRERSDRFVPENRIMVRNERIRRDFQLYQEVFRKEPRLDVLRRQFAARGRVDRRQESDFGRQTRDHHEDLSELDEGTYSDFREIREKFKTNSNRRRDLIPSQRNTEDIRRIFSENPSLYSRLFPSMLEVMNCGMTILAAIFIYDFIRELTQKREKPKENVSRKILDGLILATKNAVIHI